MRKLRSLLLGVLLVPVTAIADTPDATKLDNVKLSYKEGTRLDFPDQGFGLKFNLRLQGIYSYEDIEGGDDRNDFSVRNIRFELEGYVLNKEFVFKVTNDFETDMDRNTGVQDAYLEWNASEDHHFRGGQIKTPFGRQWWNSSAKLQFINRSIVSDTFTFGRQGGVAYHGDIAETGHQWLGLFNGDSVLEDEMIERQNVRGLDPDLLGIYQATFDVSGKYDRNYEGDPLHSPDLNAGAGAAVYYGRAHFTADEPIAIVDEALDEYGANVDAGLRIMGFSAQGEFFYSGVKFDDVLDAGGTDEANFYGFYVQSGYFFVPNKFEVAARFGMVSSDDDAVLIYGVADEVYEYNLVAGYYVLGHNLKFLTGPTWRTEKIDGGEETTDFLYQAGFFGYF